MADDRWRDTYDAWKLRCPEDEPGYWQKPEEDEEEPELDWLDEEWIGWCLDE